MMRTRAGNLLAEPGKLVGLATLVALGAAVAVGAGPILAVLIVLGLLFLWLAVRMESRSFASLTLGLLVVVPWQHVTALGEDPVLFPVLWAVPVLVLILVARNEFPYVDRLAGLGFGLVVCWAVIGLVLGHGQFGRWANWVIFWGLGFGVFVLLSAPGALRRLIQNSWWVGFVLSAYAIIEWLLKTNVLFGSMIAGRWDPSFYAAETFRVTVTFGHPIAAAAVFGFLLTVYAWAWAHGILAPRLFALGFIPTAVALVLTGTRGALIVTVAAIVLVAIVPSRLRARQVSLLAGLLIALALVLTVIPTTVVSRFSDISNDTSFLQRTKGLAAATVIMEREPLWGMGAGYGDLALRDLGYVETNYESEYAGLLIGLGIPGAILVLGLPLLVMARPAGKGTTLAMRVAPFALFAIGILGPANMFEWWGGAILYWTALAFLSMGDRLIDTVGEPA